MFDGSGLDVFFGLIYIAKKFKNFDIPMRFNPNLGYKRNDVMNIGIRFECDIGEKRQKLYYPLDINEFYKLINISSKRFLGTFIYIKWECNSNNAHFNMIIFDKDTKTIERFEPYTKFTKSVPANIMERLDAKLKHDCKKYLKYKYIPPKQVCPRIGFQTKEESELTVGNLDIFSDPGGFCGAWSLYFLDLKLSFPNYDTKKLMKKAFSYLEKDKHSFRTFIRNYSDFIVKKRKSILRKYNQISDADQYDIKTFIENKFSELIQRK